MSQAEPSIYENGQYIRRNPTYHVEDSAWKVGQILGMLERHPSQPKTIAEIGCGAGEVLRQLQLHLPESTQFYGYDVSSQAIALARSRANDRLRFECADLLAVDVPAFDVLLCIDVFEHVDDYMTFLRRLRPRSTYKIFHIPLDISVQTVLRSTMVRARERIGHLHYFTKETALATLRDTGYEVVDWFYTPSGLFSTRTTLARLAFLPRRLMAMISADLAARILGGFSLLVLAR